MQPSCNPERSVAVNPELAEQGDAAAPVRLGRLLQGHGVPRDYAEARVWFRKAADQFHPYAFQTSETCMRGRRAADQTEASHFYSEPLISQCDGGDWDPDWVLGAVWQGLSTARRASSSSLFYARQIDAQQDHTEAVKWYRKAAIRDTSKLSSIWAGP